LKKQQKGSGGKEKAGLFKDPALSKGQQAQATRLTKTAYFVCGKIKTSSFTHGVIRNEIIQFRFLSVCQIRKFSTTLP
jgi:hypothetical protein